MEKDRRYTTEKKLITGGFLNSFGEIFDIVPKSVVARDLGMNNMRFSKLISQPDLFRLSDIFRLATLLEIDGLILLTLVIKHAQVEKRTKK